MRTPFGLPQIPLESREPIVSFAVIRALTCVAAALALAILGFPYGGTATAVIAGLALPWALGVLAVTRRSTDAGLSPLVALGQVRDGRPRQDVP